MKQDFREAFPETYSIREIIEKYGWEFEVINEGTQDERFVNVTCCGQAVEMSGIFGTERIYCEKCGKATFILGSFVPLGNGYGGIIDLEEYENVDYSRLWIATEVRAAND